MDEIAIDAGGVSRNSFLAFLMKLTIIFLIVNLCMCHAIISSVTGSHYLAVEVFPDCIAFPCLAAVLLGTITMISDSVMLECFFSSLECS